VLRFPAVSDAEIDAVLRREAPEADAATRAAAIAASAGSPGAALDFVGLGDLHAIMQQLVRFGEADVARRGKLAAAMGARPDRQRQLAAIDLARAVVAEAMHGVERPAIPALADAHEELSRLAAQAPTYNYDAGLLVMEIGSLLAALATSNAPAHG
jgi:DNA polymerase-3 subunit delta'